MNIIRIKHVHLIFMAMFLIYSSAIICQTPPSTTCPNSDFSQGNFGNWNGCYGSWANPCATPGFDTTSAYPLHKIFSDVAALDPNTCNNMLKVCPGETHSARVGHDGGTSQAAAQLKYSIQVSTQPYYFIYKYAVVLDNGNHLPYQQPCFIVEITDSAGNWVDSIHGYQYFSSGPGVPGWQNCAIGPGINWKDWTSDTVDLSAFAGQTVIATFTSRDCQFGGHHGYAYINAYCTGPVTRQWTGAVSDGWNDPGNWSPAGVPSNIDLVIIPVSATTMPVINATGMHCQDLMIENGATVTIPEGFSLIVDGDVYLNLPK